MLPDDLLSHVPFSVCIGKFKKIPDMMHLHGHERQDITTSLGCEEACMELAGYCAAADFRDGKCFIHDKNNYSVKGLIPSEGSMHFNLLACV